MTSFLRTSVRLWARPRHVNTDRPFSIKNIALFKPDPGVIEGRYLYYLVRSRHFQEAVKAARTGSAQPFIGLAQLRRHRVRYHSELTEQARIAGILSAYDDLAENDAQRVRILEEMAQRILREKLGEEVLREEVESVQGLMDQGWSLVALGDVARLEKQKFHEGVHEDRPLLDLARMQQSTLLVRETGVPSELATSRIVFEEGDVLFGSIRPYLHKVSLAPWPGVTNVSVLVLRALEERLGSFLAVLLSSDEAVRWADQHSSGTKMPVIKWDVLRTMPVLLPPDTALLSFNAAVEPLVQGGEGRLASNPEPSPNA